jgi:stage II sporulation protein AB (anti-sigma F factor)
LDERVNLLNYAKLSFKSVPENVAFARSCAGAFAAQLTCTLEDIEELKLAVSEAVSNCVIHAYQNAPEGLIDIAISLFTDQTIEIQIGDSGCGIADVKQAMEPAFSSEPGRMGLGFAFMQSFMDQVEVKSVLRQGTLITMRRRFQVCDSTAPEILC